MNWIKTFAAIFTLCSSTAWGATLTWDANSESDMAGYRVYQCIQLPCTRTSGNAASLATLGTVTSYNIGTPSAIRYFFVTAYDTSNLESNESAVVTYTPPPVTPVIGVTPISLSFAAIMGGANPAAQTFSISNSGGGTLSWSVSDNAAWLSLSPTAGTGNGVVTVSVNTGTLAAGTYNGSITINATGAPSVTLPVTVTVNAAPITYSTPPTPKGLRLGWFK